ncbi:MAG: GNAT family N-acetyltransferase [Pseudomonadota bacterium]
MYNTALVPDDYAVPLRFETNRVVLRPLTVHDVVRDYDAVMSSETRLKTVFREQREWPTGLTLEQNLIELGWHQVEFQERTSFAYTVLNDSEDVVLGCVYFYPTQKADFDVEVTMWVRESEADTGLDAHLFNSVKNWLAAEWPFQNPAYPGRNITWGDWGNL